ncbi:hypothetical protein PNA2_1429 [Pyrococcus sp. NA2]|uniref:helix-turn-helix domain-containing protein n=1 Tax=Pyrococcus sp. (strain NA2) TaxID=342949 RepID=UPI000209AF26|nr:helix-turn-helix domain-containing protein [Pyrococcus sp. NA2]AEC52344.1 hypothetical protein PNA2_1429 [Pyrococcus sp. NA2]
MLVLLHTEGTNVRECITKINKEILRKLPISGRITKVKVKIEMGAFFSLSISLIIDTSEAYRPGILVDYAVGSKDEALSELQEKLNRKIPVDAEILDFIWETYTTPVTRRTYIVGVLPYNRPLLRKYSDMKIEGRRKILSKVLELLNDNPKALNISELARMFGVSRDTIYNDIQQILKEREG